MQTYCPPPPDPFPPASSPGHSRKSYFLPLLTNFRSLTTQERRAILVLLLVNPVLVSIYLGARSQIVPPLIGVAAIGLIVFGRRLRGDVGLSPLTRLLCLSFGGLLLSLVGWWACARLYVATTDWHHDVFRLITRHAAQVPLYGGAAASTSLGGAILAAVCVGAACVWLACRGDHWQKERRIWPFLLAAYAILMLCFATTDGISRLWRPTVHFGTFFNDAGNFHSSLDLWSHYVAMMPSLSSRTAHYPPGVVWLYLMERQTGVSGLVRLLNYGAAVGTVALVRPLAQSLRYRIEEVNFAVALCCTSVDMLVFPSTAPDLLIAFFATSALLAFVRAMYANSLVAALLLGLLMACVTLLSFSASVVGVLLAAIAAAALWRRSAPAMVVLRVGLIAAFVYVAVFVVFHHALDFDVIACLRASVRNNQAGMADGFDTPTRWFLRSSGNLLAYMGALGPALLAFVLAAWKERARLDVVRQSLAMGVFLTLVVASVSGLYFMETERIWLFFTPVLSLVAAGTGYRLGRSFALIWSLLFALAFELTFRHWL